MFKVANTVSDTLYPFNIQDLNYFSVENICLFFMASFLSPWLFRSTCQFLIGIFKLYFCFWFPLNLFGSENLMVIIPFEIGWD